MKTIVIKSIGTASQNASKIVADAFQMNHEMVARMLYNAPIVFLEQVDEVVGQKAFDILSKLGLEVTVLGDGEELPKKSELLDVFVFVRDPLKKIAIAKQLSAFIGIPENDAIRLLLNESCVVLGDVSLATAEKLQKYIDAEVIASNPKTDSFTIEITSEKPNFIKNFYATLKQVGIQPEKSIKQIHNIPYEQAQAVWKRFPNSKEFLIYNQAYQRYKIVLKNFDTADSEAKSFLVETIGMSEESLDRVHRNLPVVIDESLSSIEKENRLETYSQVGLQCEGVAIPIRGAIIRVSINASYGRKFEQSVTGSSSNAARRISLPPPDNLLEMLKELKPKQ